MHHRKRGCPAGVVVSISSIEFSILFELARFSLDANGRNVPASNFLIEEANTPMSCRRLRATKYNVADTDGVMT